MRVAHRCTTSNINCGWSVISSLNQHVEKVEVAEMCFGFASCCLAVAAVRLGSWQFYQRTLSCSNEQIALRLVEADVIHRITSAPSNVNCLLQVCVFRQKGDVNVTLGCLLGSMRCFNCTRMSDICNFIVFFGAS